MNEATEAEGQVIEDHRWHSSDIRAVVEAARWCDDATGWSVTAWERWTLGVLGSDCLDHGDDLA